MKLAKALYHFPCPDGITAALACHLFHKTKGIPLQLIPHTTYAPLPIEQLNLSNTDTVYLLDYSGPPGFAVEVAQRVAKCIVLDHHKTAVEHLTGPNITLPSNLEVHLDMNRSGATVALDYFNPEGLSPENVQFFKYIEDGDLWRWALPDSKAFHAGFVAANLNLDAGSNPHIFDQILNLVPGDLIASGNGELERQNTLVAAALDHAYVIDLGGGVERGGQWGQALAVEVDGELALKFRSQLGNELAAAARKKGLRAVGAVVYKEAAMEADSERVKVSLRSIGEDEDTTPVSQAFGGGGHRNASSFLISEHEFKNWMKG